jgi:hypothetical protein
MPLKLLTAILVAFFLNTSVSAAPALPELQAPDPVFKNAPARTAVPFCKRNAAASTGSQQSVIVTLVAPLSRLGSDLISMFQDLYSLSVLQQQRQPNTLVLTSAKKRTAPSTAVRQAGYARICG